MKVKGWEEETRDTFEVCSREDTLDELVLG